jgi:hypothetical protein
VRVIGLSIHNRIAEGGIAAALVPVLDGHLAPVNRPGMSGSSTL